MLKSASANRAAYLAVFLAAAFLFVGMPLAHTVQHDHLGHDHLHGSDTCDQPHVTWRTDADDACLICSFLATSPFHPPPSPAITDTDDAGIHAMMVGSTPSLRTSPRQVDPRAPPGTAV